MSTATVHVPKYRRQKFRKKRNCAKRPDVAFIEVNSQRHYLGEYGSPESKQAYNRLIAEWMTHGEVVTRRKSGPTLLRTVAVIASAYLKWAERKYTREDGSQGTRLQDTRDALKPLYLLYGDTPAEEFGPNKLKTVREQMTKANLCRKTINERISIIKRAFRKAVEFELMGADVANRLELVEGLRQGEGRESREVQPVPIHAIDAIRPWLSRPVRALIDLQLHTAARPGELVGLKASDIDTTDPTLWVTRLDAHKTAHHGKTRELYFGSRAQQLLREFMLPNRNIDLPLFSPKDAEAERLAALHSKRKTPLSCGNRPGTNRVDERKRSPDDQYDVDSYRRSISRACDAADEWAKGGVVIGNDERIIPRWHPHQLRHNAATIIRREHGVEMARLILGHSDLATTEIYAEADRARAMEIMRKIG